MLSMDHFILKSEQQFLETMMARLNQQADAMSESEKARMRARIEAKLKSGKRLTPEEERFLQQTDPQMYMQYLRIRQMAQALKTQLKQAKTKTQVNRIIATALGAVSKDDPAWEYIIAALTEVARELPDTEAELAKQKNKKPHPATKEEDKDEDDSEDSFDPMDWSPLQEVIDELPSFDHPA